MEAQRKSRSLTKIRPPKSKVAVRTNDYLISSRCSYSSSSRLELRTRLWSLSRRNRSVQMIKK